jgi:hypothetical protein
MKKRIEDLAFKVIALASVFMVIGIPMLIAMGVVVLAKIAFFVAFAAGAVALLVSAPWWR